MPGGHAASSCWLRWSASCRGWGSVVGCERHSLKAGDGYPPRIWRCCSASIAYSSWFNPSDPSFEGGLCDFLGIRRLPAIDLCKEPVPDGDHDLPLPPTAGGLLTRQEGLRTGAPSPRSPGHLDSQAHHRRHHHHQRTVLKQEPRGEARPRHASDSEGRRVGLRDEGPLRGLQPKQAHPQRGRQPRQCPASP